MVDEEVKTLKNVKWFQSNLAKSEQSYIAPKIIFTNN